LTMMWRKGKLKTADISEGKNGPNLFACPAR